MENGLYEQGEWRLWFVGSDGCKKVFGGAGSEEQVRAAFADAVKAGRNAIVVDQLGVKQLPVDEPTATDAVSSECPTDQDKINAAVMARMQVLCDSVQTLATMVSNRISELSERIEAGDKKNAHKIARLRSESTEFAGDVGDDVRKLREFAIKGHDDLEAKIGLVSSMIRLDRKGMVEVSGQVDQIRKCLQMHPEVLADINRGDEEPVESAPAQSPELVCDLPLWEQVRILQQQYCDTMDAVAENEMAVVTQGKQIKQLQDQVAKLRTYSRATRRKADLW